MVKNFVQRVLDENSFQNLPRQFRFLRNIDNADNIALMGDSKVLYEDFSDTVFKNYSSNNNANIFAPEEYRELINESDVIHEDNVEFFEYDRPTSQAADLLAETEQGSKTIAFGPREYLEDLKKVSADDIKGFYDI